MILYKVERTGEKIKQTSVQELSTREHVIPSTSLANVIGMTKIYDTCSTVIIIQVSSTRFDRSCVTYKKHMSGIANHYCWKNIKNEALFDLGARHINPCVK